MDREAAIAKLVKLAQIIVENGATPEEEDAANRLGVRLIARYGLTLAEVEAAARVEEARRRPAPRPRPMPRPVPFGWGQATTGGVFANGNTIWFEVRF